MDSTFLARMEQILALYALPVDEQYPVLCFDERPCFLIGESVMGLEMKAGTPAREHYAYQKNGSSALLMAIEPHTGQRLARVFDRRTKQEYALFMKELASELPASQEDQGRARQPQHPLDEFFLRNLQRRRSFRLVTTLRVLLYAEEGFLVEHD
jgi:hypothetical protein